jgi:hypothetical protein
MDDPSFMSMIYNLMAAHAAQPSAASPVAPIQPAARVTFRIDPHIGRVDNKVPPGTPGTVTMPVTGHVLSIPDPLSEGLIAYAVRVAEQCGKPSHGGLIIPAGPVTFNDGTLHADWPTMVDCFFNRDLYFPSL